MKFDFAIGNPPYQDDRVGENVTFAPPVYNKFMDAAYSVADKVELIHPARFLFNAGSTPKAWNKKMLEDAHFKVLEYEKDCSQVFHNTEIKGGIAITYRDITKLFKSVKIFTPYAELNSIVQKVAPANETNSLMDMIFTQNKFNLKELYAKYPESKNNIGSEGKDKRFETNIFTKITAFSDNKKKNTDIAVLGVVNNKREWKYLSEKFNDLTHPNLLRWKVLLVRVNGNGSFGDVLSAPLIERPREAYTKTFIGVGAFSSKSEAENALKYIKTKFCRAMLSVLKVTQQNNRETWRMVPIENFSNNSDIDWTKNIHEIDVQLYQKYKLNKKEIKFIEDNSKEMA